MNEMLHDWKKQPPVAKWQFFCLLIVVLVELVFLSPMGRMRGYIWIAVDQFLAIPAMAFLMLSIARGMDRKGRAMVVLSFAMVLWVALVQVMREYRGMEKILPGEITLFYAMLLPLAFALDDGKRQWGLYLLCGVFLLEGLRLCLLGGALYFGILPESYASSVYWDGARLVQVNHPTNCATLLLISIAVSLGWCVKTKKLWLRWVLIAWILVQFLVQMLTNGRTSIGLTCLFLGGGVFCLLRGTGWKRASVAFVVGLAVMAGSFLGSQKLFSLHEKAMWQQTPVMHMLEQETEVLETEEQETEETTPSEQVNVQNSLFQDMATLNGRTEIWRAAVLGLVRNPKYLACGTDSVSEVLAEEMNFPTLHTHNSFLEAAYALGLPGLLLVLVITVFGIRSAVILLWKNDDLWKSIIALLVICLLGCGMLEPYLFVGGTTQHFLSILFLSGIGYLHQWTTDTE